jgi:benzylsuccinate CoA-transferase BbsF subunit
MGEKKKKDVEPLAGVKVLDFGWIAVDPYGMKYLGDWGATVVRIESHSNPDIMRLCSPYKGGVTDLNKSVWAAQTNNSKLGISLNLRKEKAKEIAWKLIDWADVVSSGYAPGVMGRWGFGYDDVVKRKPDIVYLCSCQMGQSGPRASLAAWGYQSSAIAGFSRLLGWPDRDPLPPQGAHTDFVCPPVEAGFIMAALDYRQRTGRGVFLDQSQMETGVNLLAPILLDYQANGRIATHNGNRLSYAAPHGAYPCRGNDRWCAIAVFDDQQWQALCSSMGDVSLAKDPRFDTLWRRKQNEEELDRLVARWTTNFTAEQVEVLLQKSGIPAHVVNNSEDLFNDVQLKYRRHFRLLNHSVIGEHYYELEGFRLSKSPDAMYAGPALSEHNEYVFKELLHMNDDEISDALIDGSITTDADIPELGSFM